MTVLFQVQWFNYNYFYKKDNRNTFFDPLVLKNKNDNSKCYRVNLIEIK